MAEMIHKSCKEFFDSYVTENSSEETILSKYVDFVDLVSSHPDAETDHMHLLKPLEDNDFVLALITIGKILNIKFNYVFSNGIVNEFRQTSLYEMLTEISKHHIHAVENNGKIFTCDYHQESLFTHLHLAMIISLTRLDNQKELHDKIIHMFIGLLHDIGKFKTVGTITNGKDQWTKYPFHGEMGSGILLQAFAGSDQFKTYFSESDFEDIARTVCVHMCGYHETNKESREAKYKWSLLRIENPRVKNYLTHLSFGDHFGALRKSTVRENAKEYELSRNEFITCVNDEFDIEQFLSANQLKGLILVVRGMSGSGKSYFVKNLITYLSEKVHISQIAHIERDQIMCEIVAKTIGETCFEKATGEQYKKYYEIFLEKKMGSVINEEFKTRVGAALAANKIIIIDTVMSLFGAIDFAVPQVVKNTFIVSIDVIRTTPFVQEDADRMGYPLKKQIEIHGARELFYWLPTDTQKRLKQLSSFSTTTHMSSTNSGNKDVFRPRLCHVVTWTKDPNLNGTTEFYRQLDKIVVSSKKEVDINVDTDRYDIITYVNYLYKLHGFENMCEIIRSQGFFVDPPSQFKNNKCPVYSERIIKIKYNESCRLWKPVWARQCRNVILYLDNTTNQWICLKYHLQRGAEVFTSLHVTNGIDENENCSIKHIDHLDTIQQDTITSLLTGKPIDAIVSFKMDGSLLGISMYSGKYALITEDLITSSNDEFALSVLEIAKKMNLQFVPIISTQGTLFLGNDMMDYMITAIIPATTDINIYEEAKKFSPIELFKKHSYNFFAQLDTFYRIAKEKSFYHPIMTLSLEAICMHRASAWVQQNGRIHTELTVSYDHSTIKVLGIGYGDTKIDYLPHFAFNDVINNAGFYEPLWWNIQNGKEIEQMMIDLSETIRNPNKIIAEKLYFEKHPLNITNKVPSKLTKLNETLDYEGFVFYRKIHGSGSCTIYDYSKIKTIEYYKSHKLRDENIAYLVELGKTASNIFPITRIVTEFFGDCSGLFEKVCDQINELLNMDIDMNPLYIGLQTDKAKSSYLTQTPQVKARMLVNASDNWKNEAYKIFVKVFPKLEQTVLPRDEIDANIKGLVMKIVPWEKEYMSRINKLIDSHDKLIGALFKHLNTSLPLITDQPQEVDTN